MTDPVALLEELAKKWRGAGQLTDVATARNECADELEAILARTEAGADGAEPFGWWIECHGTDGDFGQFVTDRAFVDLLRSHGVVERETALYTHPQDASGDAVTGRVNGYMFSARAIEIITDGEVPEWITKTPGLRVTITAMQAKEAK